jgi:hypothetical protein
MALKDMKRTKADEKARKARFSNGCIGSSDVDEYPWSLRLTLNDEELKKLGISSLPKAGTKMSLTAEVSVTSVRSSERISGGDDRSIELQITKMDLGAKSAGSAVDAVQQGIDDAE